MTVAAWSFLLVGFLGGVFQANSQRKYFSLEAQLTAHDNLIEVALEIKKTIAFVVNDDRLVSAPTESQKTLIHDTKNLSSLAAALFMQVKPLADPNQAAKTEIEEKLSNHIKCLQVRLDRAARVECPHNIAVYADNFVILAAQIKRIFLEETYSKVRFWEYIRFW